MKCDVGDGEVKAHVRDGRRRETALEMEGVAATYPCLLAPKLTNPPMPRERKSFARPFLVSIQCLFLLPIGYADIVLASQPRRSVFHLRRAESGRHRKSRVSFPHRDALLTTRPAMPPQI
jgi:hypothetical protein